MRAKAHICLLLLFAACPGISFLTGCQIPRNLTRDDVSLTEREIRVRSVWLVDGTEIDFRSDSLGYAVLLDSAIVRTMYDGSFVEIPIDSIEFEGSTRYPTVQENALQNLFIAGIIVGTIALLVAQFPIDFH